MTGATDGCGGGGVGVGGRGGAGGGVLVVGYGNGLRTDDGVGPAVAARLADDPRLRDAEVRAAHQLTPELASDAAGVSLLVLVDAATGVPAGSVVVRHLDPAEPGGSVLTHHVDAAGIAGLALELWGSAPAVVTVSVGVSSLDVGDRLTSVVEAAIPRAVDAVAAIVAEHDRAGGPTGNCARAAG